MSIYTERKTLHKTRSDTTIKIMRISQWKQAMQQKRKRLEYRLEQVRSAEWNWPSTRARCEVMRVEKEIDDHDFEMFVQPMDEGEKPELSGCTS